MLKCLILAGGSGSRLWPWSRTNYPKQFLKVCGEDSFLQLTIKRLLKLVSAENLYIVTHADALAEVVSQAVSINPLLRHQILQEPAPRNTAPAIQFSIESLLRNGVEEEALLLVCPADHLIAPDELFCEQIKKAIGKAQEGSIVTFGVRPTHPETGYGYLKADGYKVTAFIEKPDRKKAEEFVLNGHYYWNAGIFLFSLKTMKEEFLEHASTLKDSISIDYAIMEKSKRLAVYPLDLTWSDIGSWQSVYDLLEKDEKKNVMQGSVHAIETTGSLLLSKKRLIATVGLEDMMVIETEDAILKVAPRKDAQKIKKIVEDLKGNSVVREPQTVERPWGSYAILEEGPRFKIKKITVSPKQQLSLQMHYHRSEHWVVVKGTAEVTIQDQKQVIHEGQSIFVPKSALHRVANPGKIHLEIIEVQVGEYLGEDDIIRVEDVYGRLNAQESFKVLIDSKKSES